MSLAEQFAGAIERAHSDELNELHHEVWLALDAEEIALAEHDALVEQLAKRRATLNRHDRRAAAARKRRKIFGNDYARGLDGSAKARLFGWACRLMRKSEEDKAEGKHYGKITAKGREVLHALLWKFHNAKSGLCFPSYEAIAEAADCARSTVYEAIKALEEAGILTWVNRLKRIWEATEEKDLFGRPCHRQRVVRTSNGYRLSEPPPPKGGKPPGPSKSDSRTGTAGQVSNSSLSSVPKPKTIPSGPLGEALLRFGTAIRGAT
jgi:Helix-turn-helix domain